MLPRCRLPAEYQYQPTALLFFAYREKTTNAARVYPRKRQLLKRLKNPDVMEIIRVLIKDRKMNLPQNARLEFGSLDKRYAETRYNPANMKNKMRPTTPVLYRISKY